MIDKSILITGSNGLIGSELVKYFSKFYKNVYGIDNNSRKIFFGDVGSTINIKKKLLNSINNYRHFSIDIRNYNKIYNLFKKIKPSVVIHCAAQPSHDYAARIPIVDFEINALSTLYLLEITKQLCKKSPFIFLSSNKVYGDSPNKILIKEKKNRWVIKEKKYKNGINENLSIDKSLHSLFGVSKASADLLVQEYGKYFGMFTCCIRGGCLTGPMQKGVELHGFLNYLIKCNIEKKTYNIYGYKGKQVRDNIHSYDVVKFIHHFLKNPKKGEIYNLGGGFKNSISIKEAIKKIESISKIRMKTRYFKKNRIGDHICYYTDLSKAKEHYPKWQITKNLDNIFLEIYENWTKIKK